MASPVVADPSVVAANVDADADARFETIKQQALGGAPLAPPAAAAPVQPETPAAPVPAPPVQATPAAAPSPEPTPPASPTTPVAPADVITIDLKALPAEEQQAWRDALVKTGGDPSKVGVLMWEYNNRLAALHNAPPGAVAPAAPPAAQPPAAPAPPAPPVEERIESELAEAIPADQRVMELRAQHSAHIETIKSICEPLGVKFESPKSALPAVDAALNKLERDTDHWQRLLADPDIDATKADTINRQLLAAERQQIKLEHIKAKVEGLQQAFVARRGELRASIADRLYTEHEAIKADQDAQTDRSKYEGEFKAAWPGYVSAAVVAGKVEPELAADFEAFAKAHALLEMGAGRLDLTREAAPVTLPPFLASLATKFLADVERQSRAFSAVQARKAAGAGAAAPILIPDGSRAPSAPAPGTNGVPQNGNVQKSADIDEAADNRVSQLFANLRGQVRA